MGADLLPVTSGAGLRGPLPPRRRLLLGSCSVLVSPVLRSRSARLQRVPCQGGLCAYVMLRWPRQLRLAGVWAGGLARLSEGPLGAARILTSVTLTPSGALCVANCLLSLPVTGAHEIECRHRCFSLLSRVYRSRKRLAVRTLPVLAWPSPGEDLNFFSTFFSRLDRSRIPPPSPGCSRSTASSPAWTRGRRPSALSALSLSIHRL